MLEGVVASDVSCWGVSVPKVFEKEVVRASEWQGNIAAQLFPAPFLDNTNINCTFAEE